MVRDFNVPEFYRSNTITALKHARRRSDPKRRDFDPSTLDFGPVRFNVARHFGFCFGVENAIEIAYRALEENPGRRIFLLSEMIHNPDVNADLEARGVGFLMSPDGTVRIPFETLRPEDVVIVPAFGTTIQLQQQLEQRGIDPYFYDTTCPFVEKVWKRAADLGRQGYSVVIHGKRIHEETRATFSHSEVTANTVVVRDMDDTKFLVRCILGEETREAFFERFGACVSEGFDPEQHLVRVGVVNQTTMLASETHAIAQRIRAALNERYGDENIREHFADTRDTLCYATNENQSATIELIKHQADLAIVVGGYNSSNTSHLVELCEEKLPTYYIKNASEIADRNEIRCFDLHSKTVVSKRDWLPQSTNGHPLTIALTSGASCPDKTVDEVLTRILEFFPNSRTSEEVVAKYIQ